MQLLSGDTEVLCSLRGTGIGADTTQSLLARLPRSGRIVAVTAHSRLHLFTGGPDALGFFDVLPRSGSSRCVVIRHGCPRRPRPGSRPRRRSATAPAALPAEEGDLDAALFAALAVDGRTPYADLAAATGWSETTVRRRMDQLRDAGVLYFDLELDMPTFGFRILGVAVAVGAAIAPGGGRHRPGEVLRGRLRDRHDRARRTSPPASSAATKSRCMSS